MQELEMRYRLADIHTQDIHEKEFDQVLEAMKYLGSHSRQGPICTMKVTEILRYHQSDGNTLPPEKQKMHPYTACVAQPFVTGGTVPQISTLTP